METNYPLGVTMPHEIAPGVFMEDHQHWAMNSYAGEGKYVKDGDSSGCLIDRRICTSPKIAIYRHYWSNKGRISCFLSYPYGMVAEGYYFWEIYCFEGNLFEDIERFATEKDCHSRIIQLLNGD